MVFNIGGAFIVKGFSLLISLFTIPLYMKFFGNEVIMGLWFTLVSVLSWILNFDLGIGNGLRNKLVYYLVEDDPDKIQQTISSSYIISSLISCILGIISIIVGYTFHWNKFFNVSYDLIPADSLRKIVLTILLGLVLQFFLKLSSSILYALQKSAIVNAMSFVTNLFNLLFIYFYSSSNYVEGLYILSIVFVLNMNLPYLLATFYLFLGPLKNFFPRLKYWEKNLALSTMKLGLKFFFVQILYMVLINTNEFLISYLFNPSFVVEFQIYNKIFTLGSTIFILILTPVWSAVTKAIAENRYEWMSILFKRIVSLSIIGIVIQLIISFFLQSIVDVWLRSQTVEINRVYSFIFAIYGGILILNSVFSSFANGLSEIRSQLYLFSIACLLRIIFLYLLKDQEIGWISIPISLILCLIPYSIFQPIILMKKMKRRIKDE